MNKLTHAARLFSCRIKTYDLIFLVDRQKSHRSDTVLVQELLPNGFTVFSSDRSQRKKKGLMFLALKKNGAPKNALKTSATHKSVHFTVILCTRKRKHLTMTGVSSTC